MNLFIILSVLINIIFLIILYFIEIQKHDCIKKTAYKYITYNNIKSHIKSGDLILFSAFEYSPVTRIFGHAGFSHMGLVVKQNNKLYSLEMIRNDILYPNNSLTTGLILHPLEDRIKYYQGYVYHASLLNPLTNLEENKLFNYSKKQFFMPSNYLIFLLNFKQNFAINSTRKFCSQFVVNILEDLNIIERKDPYKFWNYNRKLVNLCNNTIYSNPIQIISNDLIITNIDDREPIYFN